MNKSQPILAIFDELFRGTNVKDAYDASVAIIKAFAKSARVLFYHFNAYRKGSQ